MRRIYFILISLLLCLLSAGCGKEDSSVYYDIQRESAPFFVDAKAFAGKDIFYRCLGIQFLQEEPAQLWVFFDENYGKVDLYKFRMDGSREFLMGGLPEEIFSASNPLGYIDESGSLYLFYNNTAKSTNITIKYDSSGTQAYLHEEEGCLYVNDICQIPDGRIFINYSIEEEPYAFGELDLATGSISRVSSFRYGYAMWMGTGSGGLLCMTMDGISEIDPENGSKENIWPFTGTTFEESTLGEVLDFMVTEEGEVRLLYRKPIGSSVMYETLQKVEMEEKKKPVVMRGLEFSGNDGAWLKQMVYRFNEENDTYYVRLEECGIDADWDDYARQTSIEVGAGKGPDLFYEDVLGEYAYGIALKGGLVDLAPYIEKAGIEEGDYFPCTFGRWRDGSKIYSITAYISLSVAYYMDADLLSGSREPGIEALAEGLLTQPGDGIFMDGKDSAGVLGMFLEGTEDIWGMVDWDAGTCNFETDLFASLLEAAKRYGDDGRKNMTDLVEATIYDLFQYMDSAMLEKEGKVAVAPLFDDGFHVTPRTGFALAVNANSVQKEGAWEFISFLLGEEAQATNPSSIGPPFLPEYPVSRKAFKALIKKEQAVGREARTTTSSGTTIIIRGSYDLTDERAAEIEEIVENARFLPTKTAPILEIIYDEAQDYFDGIKDIDEIIALINNRVQLYLNELDM